MADVFLNFLQNDPGRLELLVDALTEWGTTNGGIVTYGLECTLVRRYRL